MGRGEPQPSHSTQSTGERPFNTMMNILYSMLKVEMPMKKTKAGLARSVTHWWAGREELMIVTKWHFT